MITRRKTQSKKTLSRKFRVKISPIIDIEPRPRHLENWMKNYCYHEPRRYWLGRVNIQTNCRQWLHELQTKHSKTMPGYMIHEYLCANKSIKNCYDLSELLAIQKKGVAFFRKHFKGKKVFGWRGTVETMVGGCSVPYLYESEGKVILSWSSLSNDWDQKCPALMYRKLEVRN